MTLSLILGIVDKTSPTFEEKTSNFIYALLRSLTTFLILFRCLFSIIIQMTAIRLKIRPIYTSPKIQDSALGEVSRTPPEKTHIQQPQAEASPNMLQQMQNMVKYSLNITNQKKDSLGSGLQCRDRIIHSVFKFTQEQMLKDEIVQEWIGETCRNVVSTSFHNYFHENMTFRQAKVYCCQEILRNISEFAQKHEVSAKLFNNMDRIMQEKVMPYLALKYPLSEYANPNRALSKVVKEIDNMEVLSNDFFFNSDISLTYRDNGNYNDVIMRVLNQLISLADSQSPSSCPSMDESSPEDLTNFQHFDDYITQIIDKIYDPLWMNQKGTKENLLLRQPSMGMMGMNKDPSFGLDSQRYLRDVRGWDQAEKYKEKVQEYTQYDIGRKIPQSVGCFTQEEIRSGHLVVRSPQILRIMTKWCEQLWKKFENQNYYIDKAEGITMINSKQINILYEWIRVALKQHLKDQKAKILKYMTSVETNLYQQEFKILQSQLLSKEAPFLNRYERVCGKFSTKVVNNLKNCVVVYLNRLIHGLMSVSDSLFKTKMKGMPSWPSPPNLMSFKVGDLLRCRVTSHQKQIVRLYQQLFKFHKITLIS